MITAITGKCQFEGCDKDAACIACANDGTPEGGPSDIPDQYRQPKCYCNKHGREVADLGCFEYVCECPNCHCSFGI